ncbi:MAG: hypothetical protein M1819_007272 [Sarea resinae]|nr:MAG: hypothetical protein M1819_007272 [Sarea resinae]
MTERREPNDPIDLTTSSGDDVTAPLISAKQAASLNTRSRLATPVEDQSQSAIEPDLRHYDLSEDGFELTNSKRRRKRREAELLHLDEDEMSSPASAGKSRTKSLVNPGNTTSVTSFDPYLQPSVIEDAFSTSTSEQASDLVFGGRYESQGSIANVSSKATGPGGKSTKLST